MDAAYHIASYTGYVYPNETVFPWSVLIVVYPYLTGLVAGAFTVSSFYHVFGMQRFQPVARLALLTALSFMMFVPMPLLVHLGQPLRAFNPILTPHLTSAMAIFGYAASFYVLLLLLENWFAFRPEIVAKAHSSTGPLRYFYRALTLGSNDVSANAMKYDHKWLFALAVIGIPAAHGLHGYVGFVFGSLKAREWWASDLMPVVFLFSAVISGVSALIALYVLTSKFRKTPIDHECLKGMAYVLWGFMMFTLVLEGLEFANIVYKGREGIEMIMEYVKGPLVIPYFVVQFGIGSILPIIILSLMIARGTAGKQFVVGVTVCAILVLISVFMMRWNVVIGGQEISKTGKGLLSYHLPIVDREGLLPAVAILVSPLLLLWVLTHLFPPWLSVPTESASVRQAVS